nr:type II secretion system protein GspG [Candidatus Krumholzibacteria bacterium]
EGFALMGILVVIAVVAILAGVLGPMAYRQMMEGKIRTTQLEMQAIQEALGYFYVDTGRFPTEAEGLAALVSDPGLAGWRGPYLTGDRWASMQEVTRDAFGEAYIYDQDPDLSPPAHTEILLASGGSDNTITTGRLNGVWSVASPGNDILVQVDSDRWNRSKTGAAQEELQALSHAAQAYFQDIGAFPTSLSLLAGTYLDAGLSQDAFTDPWLRPYGLSLDNGATPPTLQVFSLGPNGLNDGFAGDDIRFNVDSAGPGRARTMSLLSVAQTAVTSQSATDLTGDWSADYLAFGLSEVFLRDGWGQLLEESKALRTLVSAGPDGNYLTADDNIPRGVTPD